MIDYNNFKLPKEALVDKFIAKSKFYEKTALSPKLQKDFVDKIQKITWKYKLAESTVGITKAGKVTEIQIFEIELKEERIPHNLLKVIDKAIPYPILYCFVHQASVAYGISLKDSNSENYYFSDWNEEKNFDFSGLDLEKVYQKLIKSFIREEVQNQSSFAEIIQIDSKIKALENEIAILENKISKEKQFNRKVEINKLLLERKKQLIHLMNCE